MLLVYSWRQEAVVAAMAARVEAASEWADGPGSECEKEGSFVLDKVTEAIPKL